MAGDVKATLTAVSAALSSNMAVSAPRSTSTRINKEDIELAEIDSNGDDTQQPDVCNARITANSFAEIAVESPSTKGDASQAALNSVFKNPLGTSISLHNVEVVVQMVADKDKFLGIPIPGRSEQTTKSLLKGITGVIHSGKCHAMMGPSGAGKTTLLDVISKRKDQGSVSGEVLFDGKRPSMHAIKKDTAYVQQNDALAGDFTVHENLMFVGMVKLPGIKVAERKRRVMEIIHQTGLAACEHTRIGNRFFKGVSGGEKKRVSIAGCLISMPRCIFLDEPTTGLDSATALSIVLTIKRMQLTSGCTQLMTIHQPSPAIYDLFDRIVLLHQGKLCYFGDGHQSPIDFFASQGFPYRSGYNVAEFLLESIVVGSKQVFKLTSTDDEESDCDDAVDDDDGRIATSPTSASGAPTHADLKSIKTEVKAQAAEEQNHDFAQFYQDSEQRAKNLNEATLVMNESKVVLHASRSKTPEDLSAVVTMNNAIPNSPCEPNSIRQPHLPGDHCNPSIPSGKDLQRVPAAPDNGILAEIWILARYRSIPRQLNVLYAFTRIGLPLLLSLMLTSFFYGQDYDITGITNVTGIIFISSLLPNFYAQVFIEDIKLDREVYTRESQDAYYRPSSYVLTRMLTEIPATLVAAIVYSSILYPLVGLNDSPGAFEFFMLQFFLFLTQASMLGMAFGAIFPGEATPSVLLPLFTTLNMLVSGFFIRKATIQPLWVWMYYISYMQWGFSAAMLNQFEEQTYLDHCSGDVEFPPMIGFPREFQDPSFVKLAFDTIGCPPLYGNDILTLFSLDGRSKWRCIAYGLCTYPVLLLLCYCGVRFIKHEKR